MAFTTLTPTVHIGPLSDTENPFTAAVPREHPGRLHHVIIDEGFQLTRPQLAPRETTVDIQIMDDADEYNQRRIRLGDLVVVRQSRDGGSPVTVFRGRAYTPEELERQLNKVLLRIRAHGLWVRFANLHQVHVAQEQDVGGKTAVDAILDQVEWPDAFRDVRVPPPGTDEVFGEWAFDGKPAVGVSETLEGIHPRSRFWVDAKGNFRVVWVPGNLQALERGNVNSELRSLEMDIHLLNQVVVPGVNISRTTTTHWSSTTAFDLVDDEDTEIFNGQLMGEANDATWSILMRQPNGTFFPVHPDVEISLTATYIRGTDQLFDVTLTARSKSGDYTTTDDFFHIQSTETTNELSGDDPQIFNQDGVAADRPRTKRLPALDYAEDAVRDLAENWLSLWSRPANFISFESRLSDDATVDKIEALDLWDRMSVDDGEHMVHGFLVRKQTAYRMPVPRATLTMLEDFTEGGQIALPYRPPFRWVFDSLAALDMFFERDDTLTNQGHWNEETAGGSSPTANTGPTPNNALPFVHTETSGGNPADHEDNGTINVLDEPFEVITNRDIIVRYAAYGDFAAGDGLAVEGREVHISTVYDLLVVDRVSNGGTLWRINVLDPDDETTPFGEIGDIPSDLGTPGGIALDRNGDLLVVETFVTNELWRINVLDPDDETGIYGQIGNLPTAPPETFGLINGRGLTIEASGDLLVAVHGSGSGVFTGLWRISVNQPDLVSGIYGYLGDLYTTDQFEVEAINMDTEGNLYVCGPFFGSGTIGRPGYIPPAGWFKRVDLNDPDARNPPYEPRDLPSGVLNPVGMGIDGDNNFWIINRVVGSPNPPDQLWLINPDDPSDETGNFGLVGTLPSSLETAESVAVQPRTVINYGPWEPIEVLPASAYPSGNLNQHAGVTDVDGTEYIVVEDGGWRDFEVSIPKRFGEIRLRPALNAGGTAARQDIALRSIRNAEGN